MINRFARVVTVATACVALIATAPAYADGGKSLSSLKEQQAKLRAQLQQLEESLQSLEKQIQKSKKGTSRRSSVKSSDAFGFQTLPGRKAPAASIRFDTPPKAASAPKGTLSFGKLPPPNGAQSVELLSVPRLPLRKSKASNPTFGLSSDKKAARQIIWYEPPTADCCDDDKKATKKSKKKKDKKKSKKKKGKKSKKKAKKSKSSEGIRWQLNKTQKLPAPKKAEKAKEYRFYELESGGKKKASGAAGAWITPLEGKKNSFTWSTRKGSQKKGDTITWATPHAAKGKGKGKGADDAVIWATPHSTKGKGAGAAKGADDVIIWTVPDGSKKAKPHVLKLHTGDGKEIEAIIEFDVEAHGMSDHGLGHDKGREHDGHARRPAGVAGGQAVDPRAGRFRLSAPDTGKSGTFRFDSRSKPGERVELLLREQERPSTGGTQLRHTKAESIDKKMVRRILRVEHNNPVIFLDFGSDKELERRVMRAIQGAMRGHREGTIDRLPTSRPARRGGIQLIDPTTAVEPAPLSTVTVSQEAVKREAPKKQLIEF